MNQASNTSPEANLQAVLARADVDSLVHADTPTPNRCIRVLLADDHNLVRATLAAWLSTCGDFQIVAEAADSSQAIELAIDLRPDIVLLDIDMPGLLAFEATKTIAEKAPRTRTVFLSAFCLDDFIAQALAANARGYLTKDQSPQSIADALRTIAGGGRAFSPLIQPRLIIDADGVRLNDSVAGKISTLNTRELDVIRLLAQGENSQSIAKQMFLSVKTVENYYATAMKKLDVHSRLDLVRFAIREGIARP